MKLELLQVWSGGFLKNKLLLEYEGCAQYYQCQHKCVLGGKIVINKLSFVIYTQLFLLFEQKNKCHEKDQQ